MLKELDGDVTQLQKDILDQDITEDQTPGEACGGPTRQSSESRGEDKIGGDHQPKSHKISGLLSIRERVDKNSKGVGKTGKRTGQPHRGTRMYR